MEIHIHYNYDFTITYTSSHENYIARYTCLELNFDLIYDYLILLIETAYIPVGQQKIPYTQIPYLSFQRHSCGRRFCSVFDYL